MREDEKSIQKFMLPLKGERGFNTVCDYGFKRIPQKSTALCISIQCQNDPTDVILIGEDSEPAIPNQIPSVNFSIVTSSDTYNFFQLLCPSIVAEFLTEDVVCNGSFVTFVQSSSPEITYFLSLKEHYRAKMIKVRNSRLKSELDEIDHKLDDLRELVKKCSEINISPSVD